MTALTPVIRHEIRFPFQNCHPRAGEKEGRRGGVDVNTRHADKNINGKL